MRGWHLSVWRSAPPRERTDNTSIGSLRAPERPSLTCYETTSRTSRRRRRARRGQHPGPALAQKVVPQLSPAQQPSRTRRAAEQQQDPGGALTGSERRASTMTVRAVSRVPAPANWFPEPLLLPPQHSSPSLSAPCLSSCSTDLSGHRQTLWVFALKAAALLQQLPQWPLSRLR